MHNIKMMQKDIKYDFNIDRIKIMYGNDFNKKYNFIQIMKKAILGKQLEYDEENNINTTFMFDDNINSNFEIYEVNGSYDIETDLKLNTKSLSHKYLASIINDIEYNETFSTLKILFNDLNDLYLNDISISINDKKVSYNIDFTINDLLKLINCNVKKNDLVMSIYDLSYEEVILYQLYMYITIAKNSTKNYFIIITSIMTDNLYSFIKSVSIDNMYFIILDNYKCNDLDEYYIINNYSIDLYNKEENYTFLSNKLPFYLEQESIDKLFKDYIYDIDNNRVLELKKII